MMTHHATLRCQQRGLRPADVHTIIAQADIDEPVGNNCRLPQLSRERTTRFTMLLHLPRMEGHGKAKSVKNGPALAGHGAEAVRDAVSKTIMDLPSHLRRSLTWDQGVEMAQHAQLRIDTGLEIYFCDPQSPWQRGSNENTNGLLRQYFPKGTDLSQHGTNELSAVAHALNTRPRKTLDWQTPAEALERLLKQDINEGVATTG